MLFCAALFYLRKRWISSPLITIALVLHFTVWAWATSSYVNVPVVISALRSSQYYHPWGAHFRFRSSRDCIQLRVPYIRISGQPNMGALSHPDIGEPYFNWLLIAWRREYRTGGSPFRPLPFSGFERVGGFCAFESAEVGFSFLKFCIAIPQIPLDLFFNGIAELLSPFSLPKPFPLSHLFLY